MRNPNGFGGVSKLSGKRRKPYRARITTGYDANGKQQYKIIGYYAKRKEAIDALAAYHYSPVTFQSANVTFAEVYDLMIAEKFGGEESQNKKVYKASYTACAPIAGMKMNQIKASHLQSVIDDCGKNLPSLKKIKALINQCYNYAVKNDIVDKDYSQYIDLKKHSDYSGKLNRQPFSETEIDKLWSKVNDHQWIDSILIMIYTGMRIGELLGVKSIDVNLDENYLRGGSKTAAGKNRVIPIHNRIKPLIENRLKDGKNLLIVDSGGAVPYHVFLDTHWSKIMDDLEMSHLPHDCRHTFASRADTAGMNKLCIKRIMGHATSDITDRVYTHKEIEELAIEVSKLK